MFGDISTICDPSERELSAKPHVYPKLAGGLLCAAILTYSVCVCEFWMQNSNALIMFASIFVYLLFLFSIFLCFLSLSFLFATDFIEIKIFVFF